MRTDFHTACAEIRPKIIQARDYAAVRAAELLRPESRFERVLLLPRQGGKTSLMRKTSHGSDGPLSTNGGWLDESGQTLDEMAKAIVGMLRIYRFERSYFPQYNPKITLRPETWDLLKGRFHWLGDHYVARLEFPHEAFYAGLRDAGVTEQALEFFGLTWLKHFRDAAGRLYPGLAFDALRRTCEKAETMPAVATCKWQGAADACEAFLLGMPDIAYWLVHMVPGDRATLTGGRFSISFERFNRRLSQARRNDPSRHLPYELSAGEFARWGQVAGIWSRASGARYYAFATPYSIGVSKIKTRLTDAGTRRMTSL